MMCDRMPRVPSLVVGMSPLGAGVGPSGLALGVDVVDAAVGVPVPGPAVRQRPDAALGSSRGALLPHGRLGVGGAAVGV